MKDRAGAIIGASATIITALAVLLAQRNHYDHNLACMQPDVGEMMFEAQNVEVSVDSGIYRVKFADGEEAHYIPTEHTICRVWKTKKET